MIVGGEALAGVPKIKNAEKTITSTNAIAMMRLHMRRDTAFADTADSELTYTPSPSTVRLPPGESSEPPDAPAPGAEGINVRGDKDNGDVRAAASRQTSGEEGCGTVNFDRRRMVCSRKIFRAAREDAGPRPEGRARLYRKEARGVTRSRGRMEPPPCRRGDPTRRG